MERAFTRAATFAHPFGYFDADRLCTKVITFLLLGDLGV